MHEIKETPAATDRLYNPKRRLMEQSDRQITFETEVYVVRTFWTS